MTSIQVVLLLAGGLIFVGVLSVVLPIADRPWTARSLFRLVGAMLVVVIVFMLYVQEAGKERDAAREADRAQIEANQRAVENSEYEACVGRNEDRLYRRDEKRALIYEAEARVAALRVGVAPVDVHAIVGYDEASDPAVRAIVDSFLANTRANNLRELAEWESTLAQRNDDLALYIDEFPVVACGDDPIPRDDSPPRPTIAPVPPPSPITLPSTTTTTTTVPPTTTTVAFVIVATTVRPQATGPTAPRPTNPPPRTTTTLDCPGNSNNCNRPGR